MLSILYVPFLALIFSTTLLDPWQWLLLLLCPPLLLGADELRKRVAIKVAV